MNKIKIIQLITRHPSSTGGINHYGLKIAENLRGEHQIFTTFLGYSKLENPSLEPHKIMVNGFPSINVYHKTANDVSSLLSSLVTEGVTAIILHYIPLGAWLLEHLKLLKQKHNFKLIVMFHDSLYIPSVLKDKISYEIRQFLGQDKGSTLIARELAKIADHVLTNTEKHESVISKWVRYPVVCIPVYSTIGEPQFIPPLGKRDRRMIVFGTPRRRKKVYQEAIQELIESCHNLGIQEIVDIGRSRDGKQEVKIPDIQDLTIQVMGEQPSERISQVMLTSLAGFIDYDLAYIGKSTILAALCAHGVIPICSKSITSASDGLEVNKHYLVPNNYLKNLNEMQLQSISDSLYRWYSNHSLEKTVEIYASLLRK